MNTVRGLLETKGYTVHAIGPEATVREALERMARANVGALVVTSGDRLLGILSERVEIHPTRKIRTIKLDLVEPRIPLLVHQYGHFTTEQIEYAQPDYR